MPKVLALLSSEKDFAITQAGQTILRDFSISHEIRLASAHQAPSYVEELLAAFHKQGGRVVICVAPLADNVAALASAFCNVPVLAVPNDSDSATGSLPSGIPVALMSPGEAGFTNAALFALQILSGHDVGLAQDLHRYRQSRAAQLIAADRQHRINFDV